PHLHHSTRPSRPAEREPPRPARRTIEHGDIEHHGGNMASGLRIDDLDVLKQQVNALLNQFDEVEAATDKARRVRLNQDSSTWSPFPAATVFAAEYREQLAKIERELRGIRDELENMRTALDKGAADLEATEDEVAAIFARLNTLALTGPPPAGPVAPDLPVRPTAPPDGNRVAW
ncbi:hypothetical protein, partial [Cellulomonas gelida]|uniref:hypothetical protein n=2 Tax=Cellulomonadaceae TaxID=85016 RepID=UPI001C3F8846